jgi:hypothetical protein
MLRNVDAAAALATTMDDTLLAALLTECGEEIKRKMAQIPTAPLAQ